MLELVRLQRAFAAERPAPTDHRSGRGHRLAAAATLDAADHELGWGSLTCPRYSLESNGAASRRFRQMRHTDEPFGRPSPACRRYPDEAERPAQRGRWRSVFLASEDASYISGQMLHPNSGGIVGSQIGVPGPGSILKKA